MRQVMEWTNSEMERDENGKQINCQVTSQLASREEKYKVQTRSSINYCNFYERTSIQNVYKTFKKFKNCLKITNSNSVL